jgi:hypothetical protein
MAADFYIVPPRLIVGTFDRSNVVTSFNSLRGDITLVANASTGVKITSSGGKFTISIIDDFYIKKAGDYVTGNIVFTPSGSNYGLAVGSGPSDPGTGATGSLFFNTSANTLRVYNGSAWGDIVSSGGISLVTADARYLKLDGTNTPTGNISMGSVFLRLANLATQSLPGVAGQIYFNTTTKVIDVYDGTKWQPAGQGITSLTPGTGISLSTNPITSYGSVSVDQSYNFTWTGSNTFTNDITFAPSQTFDISKLIASGQQSGDLIFYNGANWARVGIGTTGQVLTVGSSGIAISWLNPTGGGGGGPITSGILDAIYGGTGYSFYNLGDLLVGAGNTFIRLTRGTDHYVLSSSNTSATGLTWRTASSLASTSFSPIGSYPGDFWFDSADGSFSVWYDDGTSSQWVQVASAFSGDVFTSNQYTIPYYVSSIGLTGSNYFTNIGTGISILYNTSSTSTSTGALVVSGGVGIGGSLYTSSSYANSISGVVLNNGIIISGTWAGSTITTRYGGTGYSSYTKGDLLVGTGFTLLKLPVGADNYILSASSSSATGLTWIVNTGGGGGGGAGTVYNGSLNSIPYYPASGTAITGSANFTNTGSSINVGYSTSSTNFSSGALTVVGGVGIGGSLNVGSSLTLGQPLSGIYGGTGYTTYTKGDILVGAGSTLIKFSVGSNSYVLTADSTSATGVSWAPGASTTASFATTSANVNLTQAFSSANHSLIISPQTSGSGVALSSNPTITFNPSTNVLNVSGMAITAGTASTNTSTGALTVNGGVGISGQLTFARSSFGYTGINFNPTMSFIGNTTSSPLTFTVLTDNSLSWEGSSGQLFSIDNNLTSGEIFSVSDISGLPIISASAGQTVSINEFGGYTRIGNGSINATGTTNASLVIYGGIGITGNAFIGGTLNISNTSPSISSSSGAFTVSGGVGIGGSLYVNSASNINGVVINNGIITNGTWSGNSITGLYGGTGYTSYTKGDLLVGAGSTFVKFPVGSDSYVLVSNSSTAAGVAWTVPSSIGGTTIGTPADGLYTDGFFTSWTNSTTIANALDDINELLSQIAPARPGYLTATNLTATTVPTYYTVGISAGLGPEWYQAGYGTGSVITRYYLSGSHTLTTANTTTAFSAGSLTTSTYGTIFFNRYNNTTPIGGSVGTIDLSVNYAVNYTNNNLKLTALGTYNSIWTKANAQINTYTQPNSGYEGVYISHTENSQFTNTYEMWKDAWSASNTTPTFSQSATASTYSQTLRYLSGIGYYTTGTGFSVYFKGASGIFSSCYNTTQVYAISATGLVTATGTTSSPHYAGELDKSGNNHVRVALNSASASSFNKYITATIYKAHSTTASSNATIGRAINTYSTVSTDTYEGFQDEARRLVIGSGIAFTSNIDMANGNLQVRSGTLSYPLAADYDTEYGGVHTFTGDQEYQRYFYKTSASTGQLSLGGFTASNVSSYGTGSVNLLLYLEGDNKYFDLGVLQGSNANDGSSRAQAISAKVSTSGSGVSWSFGVYSTGVSGAGNSGRYRAIVIYKNNTYSITSITSS